MSLPVTVTSTTKTIQHFTHEAHPLTKTHDPRKYLCNGCKTLGCYTRYRCNTCDFDLHEICAMSPSILSSPYTHSQHPLSLVLQKPEGIRQNIHFCNVCGKQVNGLFYRCKICDFDVHPNCVITPSILSSHHMHPQHPLTLTLALHKPEGIHFCDACGEQVNGLFYRCKICDFDVHTVCVNLPENIKHLAHPDHLLTLQSSSQLQQLSLCNLCKLPCKNWAYRCAPCHTQFHIYCVITQATSGQPQQPSPPQPPSKVQRQQAGSVQPQQRTATPPPSSKMQQQQLLPCNSGTETISSGIGEVVGKLALNALFGGLGDLDLSSLL